MSVDPSSLLTISIGTTIALISVVAAAAVTWTRLVMRLDALTVSLKELRSWHLNATQSAAEELDDAVESFRVRQHATNTRLHTLEIRLGRLEHQAGIPISQLSDMTPVVSEPTISPGRYSSQRKPRPREKEE